MLLAKDVYLRLLEKEDLKKRVEWFNNPSINQFLVSDFPVSLSKTEQWFVKGLFDNTKLHFSIISKDNDALIGMTGLLQINRKDSKAQMYITIGEEAYHGKRLPDQIIPLVLEYAFIELNLNKVYLWTIPNNTRGRVVYERNGFIEEGVMREHIYCRGKFQDLIQHSVLKNEFLKTHLK